MKLQNIVLALTFSLLGAANAFAEPATSKSIRYLMAISDADQMPAMIVQQLRPALEHVLPDASDRFWEKFQADVDTQGIEQQVIEIYQKHLTEKDVKNLIAFYSTPTGRKIIRIQPAITQESMVLGRAWGKALAQQAIEKYEKGDYSE